MVICYGQNAPPFDGNRAMDLLRTQCDFGPRYPGSLGHQKLSNYLYDYFIYFRVCSPMAISYMVMDFFWFFLCYFLKT